MKSQVQNVPFDDVDDVAGALSDGTLFVGERLGVAVAATSSRSSGQ
jgi:hypothetical protein